MNSLREQFRSALRFSVAEKKGMLVLMILLIVISTVHEAWRSYHEKDFADEIEMTYAIFEKKLKEGRPDPEDKTFSTFDPNEIEKEDLLNMPIPSYLAERIIKFREAGGKYRTKTDLMQIYGMTPELYNGMEGYVEIKKKDLARERKMRKEKKEQVPLLFVDLNAADTNGLMALRGIGRVLSKRIIRYRESLGGFVDKSQIREVYGIDEEVYVSIEKNLFVDSLFVPERIDINVADLKEVRAHPYLRDYAFSKSLINFRTLHGPFGSTEDLRALHLMNDSLLLKIKPYIKLH